MPRAPVKPSLSKGKQWLFRLLAVAFGLILSFACLEVALRLFGPEYCRFSNSSVEYYTDPRGYFGVLRMEDGNPVYAVEVLAVPWFASEVPSDARSAELLVDLFNPEPEPRSEQERAARWLQDLQLDDIPTVRVPDGIRRPEPLTAFLSRKNTVLGLGDSFTLGRGVRYEDTYLRRLERRWAEDGHEVLIKNTGHCAYELEEVCRAYLIESSQQHYPLVIYGFVLNDFGLVGGHALFGSDYIDINNGGYQYNPWRRWFASVNYICHLIDVIRLDRITRQLYLDAFRGNHAREKFGRLKQMCHKIQADGSDLVIVLFPLMYEFDDYPFQEIHDKMADFCRREGIPLLDLLPAFSAYRAEDLWVHPIDHHPNETANAIAAEEIHRFLEGEGLLPFDGGVDERSP
ncbi:MAG: SGNH/GDSL hydrolase family protein [Planctomycetota bacterium]